MRNSNVRKVDYDEEIKKVKGKVKGKGNFLTHEAEK